MGIENYDVLKNREEKRKRLSDRSVKIGFYFNTSYSHLIMNERR